MCVDLKNIESNQAISGRLNALLNIVGIVLVIVLFGWCLRMLPAAIDQAFSMGTSTEYSDTTSRQRMESWSVRGQSDHFYHPTTHQWTFVGHSK